MKTLIYSTSSLRTSVALVLVIFSFAACSTKITFPVSRVVPAAKPEANVSKTNLGTYKISLKVSSLALPERLSRPKKYYLVWIDTPDQGLKKLGEITNNSGIFRNREKAVFEASTPHRPNMILVTAENSLEVAYPGSHVALKSRPFEMK